MAHKTEAVPATTFFRSGTASPNLNTVCEACGLTFAKHLIVPGPGDRCPCPTYEHSPACIAEPADRWLCEARGCRVLPEDRRADNTTAECIRCGLVFDDTHGHCPATGVDPCAYPDTVREHPGDAKGVQVDGEAWAWAVQRTKEQSARASADADSAVTDLDEPQACSPWPPPEMTDEDREDAKRLREMLEAKARLTRISPELAAMAERVVSALADVAVAAAEEGIDLEEEERRASGDDNAPRLYDEPVIVARGPFIPNKGLIRESFAKTKDVLPEQWREPVDLEKAREAQRRLTNVAFGNLDRETGERIRPHFEIPVNRDDDDIILLRALDELEGYRRRSMAIPLAPITHVAIRVDGVVWSLPKPFRHHNIIRLVCDLTGTKFVDCSESRGDQGFLDANGVYLDRKAALARALALKQVKDEDDIRAGMLFSEDLW